MKYTFLHEDVPAAGVTAFDGYAKPMPRPTIVKATMPTTIERGRRPMASLLRLTTLRKDTSWPLSWESQFRMSCRSGREIDEYGVWEQDSRPLAARECATWRGQGDLKVICVGVVFRRWDETWAPRTA